MPRSRGAQPGPLSTLHGCELHTGPDLENACAERLAVPATASAGRRQPVLDALGALFDDALNRSTNRSSLRPIDRLVIGTERVSGRRMCLRFRGRERTLRFVAPHVLGSRELEVLPAGAREAPVDVHVTDHPLLDRSALRARTALHVMPWVRQVCALAPTWPQTLERLPARLRKELRRLLRRRAYRARLECGGAEKHAFYENLFLPYVEQRFGADAAGLDPRVFGRLARRAALLEVRAPGNEDVMGASLLMIDGDTLVIGKSAASLKAPVPSEVLDYLCLVLAQRLGLRRLDLGVSRPHLEDGVFAYKAKWRPRLVQPARLKPAIRIRPVRLSEATRGFLSRNGFIEHRGGRFLLRRMDRTRPDSPCEEAELAARAGLDAVLIVPPPGGGTISSPVPAVAGGPGADDEDALASFLARF